MVEHGKPTETVDVNLEHKVPFESGGKRLDSVAANAFQEFSRACIQEWIKSGSLTVDGNASKPSFKLVGGERIAVQAVLEDVTEAQAENIPLHVEYEDEHILLINKPANLVVHPGAGNWRGTLLNALLFHYPELAKIPRAGIVHRLDKDTTGLMVVAKTPLAQQSLVEQLQRRSVSREYLAIACRTKCRPQWQVSGVIDLPIGRHPSQRVKMAAFEGVEPNSAGVKEAITLYETLASQPPFFLFKLNLRTGRTHQIRVHLSHCGFPLLGDFTYGAPHSNQLRLLVKKAEYFLSSEDFVYEFARPALHAYALSLVHPESGDNMQWQVAPADDMIQLCEALEFNVV